MENHKEFLSLTCERYYSSALKPFGRLSKPLSFKSKKHLDFIRGTECIINQQPYPDAHHVHKKSQGLNDYLTVPLSHSLHMELHGMEVQSFEDKHRINLKDALIARLVERILLLEAEVGEPRK